jgi:hypothetical protein
MSSLFNLSVIDASSPKKFQRNELMEVVPLYGSFISYKRGFCAWYELLIVYAIFVLLLTQHFFFSAKVTDTIAFIIFVSAFSAVSFGLLDSKTRSGIRVQIKRMSICLLLVIFAIVFIAENLEMHFSCGRRLVNGGLAVLLIAFSLSRVIRETSHLKVHELSNLEKFHLYITVSCVLIVSVTGFFILMTVASGYWDWKCNI